METDPATHSAVSGDEAKRIAIRRNGARRGAERIAIRGQAKRTYIVGDGVGW